MYSQNLDLETLRFVKDLVWRSEFLCKNTKEDKIRAKVYNSLQNTIDYYIQGAESENN